MKSCITAITLCLIFLIIIPQTLLAATLSDRDIKQQLIKASQRTYPGNCPCPYNHDRAGRRCGKRSAWSRHGGYAPLCYPDDVTKGMVERYRKHSQ